MENKVVLSAVLTVFTAAAGLGFALPANAASQPLQSPIVEKGTVDQDQGKQCPSHQRGHQGPRGAFPIIKGSAQILQMDRGSLIEELKTGKTIAEVAKSKNVDPAVLTEKLKAEMTGRIDLATADGKISKDKATAIKEHLDQRISEVINQKFDAILKDHPPLSENHESSAEKPSVVHS